MKSLFSNVKEAIAFQNRLDELQAWSENGLREFYLAKIDGRFNLKELEYSFFSDRDIESLVDSDLEMKIRVKAMLKDNNINRDFRHFPSKLGVWIIVFLFAMIITCFIPNVRTEATPKGFNMFEAITDTGEFMKVTDSSDASSLFLWISLLFLLSSVSSILGILGINFSSEPSNIPYGLLIIGFVGFVLSLPISIWLLSEPTEFEHPKALVMDSLGFSVMASLLVLVLLTLHAGNFIVKSIYNYQKFKKS